jgi:hypothetical protein
MIQDANCSQTFSRFQTEFLDIMRSPSRCDPESGLVALIRSVSKKFKAEDAVYVCFFDAKIVKDEQDSRHGNRYTRVPSPEFEHDTPLRPLFESPCLSLSW